MDVAKFSASFCHQSIDHPACKSLVGTYDRAPNGKSKVHQFQICCARTKYLSEIHRGRTIIVRAAKLFFANSPLS